MEINIEIPKWAIDKSKDNPIIILIGNELAAIKNPKEDWKIKKVRCVQCGECCMDMPPGHLPFGTSGEKCNKLKKEGNCWICTAGHMKPFACLFDPIDKDIGCAIRYF